MEAFKNDSSRYVLKAIEYEGPVDQRVHLINIKVPPMMTSKAELQNNRVRLVISMFSRIYRISQRTRMTTRYCLVLSQKLKKLG